MTRYSAKRLTCDYDAFADVLYVTFKHAASVICNETPRGFVLRRARPSGAIVGVTVLDYIEQFGRGMNEIEIDAEPPFIVEINPVDCQAAAYG
jgi:hypothetical protein